MEARHRAEPNIRPLMLSLDRVDGSSLTPPRHCTKPFSDDCKSSEVSQSVPLRMEVSNLALYPKPPVEMDVGQGDAHRSESTPPRKVNCSPSDLMSRGQRHDTTLTGDPNSGQCCRAPLERLRYG